MIKKKLLDDYSPLYFLASLGAGGAAITFFMYLMFLVPHPGTPMVTFDQLWPIVSGDDRMQGVLVGTAMLGIALFSLLHLRLLVWNLVEYRRFKHTDAYTALRTSNNEATLMAIPLTLSMSVNVMFVNGAVFVPELWSVVEWLFPFALATFLAIGALALRLYAAYFTRVISSGDFDVDGNNSLAQMIAVFAFAMIAVGLAAPGAMSHTLAVSVIGILGAIFFGTVAVSMGVLKFVMGFKSMLHNGIAPAASPSLWIVIPILTLLGIAVIRVTHGLSHGFDATVSTPWLFVMMSSVLSLQLLFGLFGHTVMQRIGYFDDFLRGEQRHAGSYALICPGVALFVFGMFFVHLGLLKNGLIEQFSPAYFAVLAPLVFVQIKTISTLLHLNARLLRAPKADLDDDADGVSMAVVGRQT